MQLNALKNWRIWFILISINFVLFGKNNSGPIPIIYGLNESHSNGWAQCTEYGTIGISYFQHNDQHSEDGSLLYKTIQPDGSQISEVVTTGKRLEVSVLLFDAQNEPHIFVAQSDNNNQSIDHYFKNGNEWKSERVIDFKNEGGKFIYELSADIASDGSFHLSVLKIRSNPDSEDYWYAYLGAYLYYLTNKDGSWQKEQIDHLHTFFTMDEYSKMLNRQDIKVDSDDKVHIIYGEQVNGEDWRNSYTILKYATNKSGEWKREIAIDAESSGRYSAGWYSSLCLDKNDIPHISCCNIDRVPTGSAMNAKLVFTTRTGNRSWTKENIAEYDDGYYGGDGRDYTGGITHLVYDKNNTPHIIFSDIASSHAGTNYFNLGNIRYATKENDKWEFNTIHQHPLPKGRYNATEIYDMCLLIADQTNQIKIIGQELDITNETTYTCKLVNYTIQQGQQKISGENILHGYHLNQNYPNPFNPNTTIRYSLFETANIRLEIFNESGRLIRTLYNGKQSAGNYLEFWDGKNNKGTKVGSGTYFYTLSTPSFIKTKKMALIK